MSCWRAGLGDDSIWPGRLGAVLRDERDPSFVKHTYEAQLRQRILQIACGYEDCNDATELRSEPAFQTAMNRVAGDESAALASQPTLSRFERRTAAEVLAMSEVMVDVWIDQLKARGAKACRDIVLEFDPTDDPTHGPQEMSMFHGYYDQYMYHPLLVFDGEGWPVSGCAAAGACFGESGSGERVAADLREDTERGQAGNFIKDLKNAMFADRLSCSRFLSNQFRLLLHAAAYIVMLELRREMANTALAKAQMDTLRLKLIKIGACIVVTARRVWVQISEFDPSRPLFEYHARRLARVPT